MTKNILSEILKVNEEKVVITEFEGNPGYTKVIGYGEMLVVEGSDFEYDSIETLLVELPENDFRKFDGENYVALYEVISVTEHDDSQNSFVTLIKRLS